MIEKLVLNRSIILEPRSPYSFDAPETIPPREQKIMAGLIFDKNMAFHHIWEDLFWRILESSEEFWRRKHEHIE